MHLPLRSYPALLAAFLAAASIAGASNGPAIFTPGAIHWSAGTGMLAGTQVAVLAGNPSQPGPYTMRMNVRPGTIFPPHYHGATEYVTVISGTLWVGLGDTVRKDRMKALPAGSFAMIPPGIHHYAMAKEATVLQIHGMGPETMSAVRK